MQPLSSFKGRHPYLVCVDSDGCAFDTMEIKHKECFCPALIQDFSLQPVSKYAREAWEFVNLYSEHRGIHRLLALLKTMDLLGCRREVRERGFFPPALPGLRDYCAHAQSLSNAGLQEYIDAHPGAEDVKLALRWSQDVNARVAQMVRGVPPFPHVAASLDSLQRDCDIVVVSATQQEALEREWVEHDLLKYVSLVCGQEQGNKRQIIAALAGQYAAGRVMMIGDAPGDMQAAGENGALFYPIRPGQEAESWAEFREVIGRFYDGSYAGACQAQAVERFRRLLPQEPAWERSE